MRILYFLVALIMIMQSANAQKGGVLVAVEANNDFFDWLQDRVALEGKCSKTQVTQRSEGLDQACDFLQSERNQAASDALAHDGAKLAYDCQETKLEDQKAPLRAACISYMAAFSTEFSHLLADDTQAHTIICEYNEGKSANNVEQPYLISSICGKSANILDDRIERNLLDDPVTLDRDCGQVSEDKMSRALFNACSERKEQKYHAQTILFVSDQGAYNKACAIYGKWLDRKLNDVALSEKEMQCYIAHKLRVNRTVRSNAKAKGLKCFDDREDSLDPPKCLSPSKYAKAKAEERSVEKITDTSICDENSSLSQEARRRAASVIAKAKVDRSFLDALPFLAQFIPE